MALAEEVLQNASQEVLFYLTAELCFTTDGNAAFK